MALMVWQPIVYAQHCIVGDVVTQLKRRGHHRRANIPRPQQDVAVHATASLRVDGLALLYGTLGSAHGAVFLHQLAGARGQRVAGVDIQELQAGGIPVGGGRGE
jgi:hypothetical protein